MGKKIQNFSIGVLVVYIIYQLYFLCRKIDNEEFNSFVSFMNFILPILFVILLLYGFYGFGCILESLDDIKEKMILMLNCEGKTKENNPIVYPMNSQDSTCQNTFYQTQNYQENRMANVKSFDTKWECSCGCENEAENRFCVNCGKKRV